MYFVNVHGWEGNKNPMEISMVENPLLGAHLTVLGLGSGGGRAVNNMIKADIAGVKFAAAHTNSHDLEKSLAPFKLLLGANTARGLGAGSRPEVGRAAAWEAQEQIKELLSGSDIVFIIAGLGGGTGTGAAPVVAAIAREMGILTIAAVTTPFEFEGRPRMRRAVAGIEELSKAADTLISIPNNRLRGLAPKGAAFVEVLQESDVVLREAVRGISELILKPGLINLGVDEIRSLMAKMPAIMMGLGRADGEDRALKAVDRAIASPLLGKSKISGASVVLMNVTAPLDISIDELETIYWHAQEQTPAGAAFVWGCVMDDGVDCDVRVSIFCQPAETEFLAQLSAAEKAYLDGDAPPAEAVPLAGNYQ
jgi:cell division protein FtsZ